MLRKTQQALHCSLVIRKERQWAGDLVTGGRSWPWARCSLPAPPSKDHSSRKRRVETKAWLKPQSCPHEGLGHHKLPIYGFYYVR